MNSSNAYTGRLENISYMSETILSCICRIEELLDEEIRLIDQGALNELERVNIRKTCLLAEFARLSPGASPSSSTEIEARLSSCRRKAERNYEALGTYLRAVEDLNRMILDFLRREESDGTYARPVSARLKEL